MKTLRSAILTSVIGFGFSAAASSANSVLITKIRVDQNGNAMVTLNTTWTPPPSPCTASGFNNSLAFSVTNDAGKAMLSALMAAKLAGRTVDVVGTGTCTIYGTNVENLNYFTVN